MGLLCLVGSHGAETSFCTLKLERSEEGDLWNEALFSIDDVAVVADRRSAQDTEALASEVVVAPVGQPLGKQQARPDHEDLVLLPLEVVGLGQRFVAGLGVGLGTELVKQNPELRLTEIKVVDRLSLGRYPEGRVPVQGLTEGELLELLVVAGQREDQVGVEAVAVEVSDGDSQLCEVALDHVVVVNGPDLGRDFRVQTFR